MAIEALTHPFLEDNVQTPLEELGESMAKQYFDNRDYYDNLRGVRHEMRRPLTYIAGIGQMLANHNKVIFRRLDDVSAGIRAFSDIFTFESALARRVFAHNPDSQRLRKDTVLLTDELVKIDRMVRVNEEVSDQLKSRLAGMERRELAGWVIGELVKGAEIIGNFVKPGNPQHPYHPSNITNAELRGQIPILQANIARVGETFPFLRAELTGQAYQRRDGDEPLDFWRIVEESKDQFNWKAGLVSGWDKVTDYVRKLRFTSDPGLLRIILENLFRNAYRYSDEYIRVTLRLFNATGNRKLIITVENDGSVIPYEEQERVWEKGRRGSNAAKKEGSGFGLYLTGKAVAVLGGEACLISGLTIKGPRTQVKVSLPIEDKYTLQG